MHPEVLHARCEAGRLRDRLHDDVGHEGHLLCATAATARVSRQGNLGTVTHLQLKRSKHRHQKAFHAAHTSTVHPDSAACVQLDAARKAFSIMSRAAMVNR